MFLFKNKVGKREFLSSDVYLKKNFYPSFDLSRGSFDFSTLRFALLLSIGNEIRSVPLSPLLLHVR